MNTTLLEGYWNHLSQEALDAAVAGTSAGKLFGLFCVFAFFSAQCILGVEAVMLLLATLRDFKKNSTLPVDAYLLPIAISILAVFFWPENDRMDTVQRIICESLAASWKIKPYLPLVFTQNDPILFLFYVLIRFIWIWRQHFPSPLGTSLLNKILLFWDQSVVIFSINLQEKPT